MPPQETGLSKKILTWLMGITVGIVITGGVFWVLYKGGLLYDFFIEYPNYQPNQTATFSPEKIIPKLNEQNVLVPKSVASKEYRDALNDLTNRFNAMVTVANQELIPTLSEIGEKYKNKDFTDFLNVIQKAKEINMQEKGLLSQLSNDLENLKVANETTIDMGAKSLTDDLIEKGEMVRDGATTIFEAIDTMLSGGVPTAEMFSNLRKAQSSFNGKIEAFDKSAQSLFEYLAQRVKEALPQ